MSFNTTLGQLAEFRSEVFMITEFNIDTLSSKKDREEFILKVMITARRFQILSFRLLDDAQTEGIHSSQAECVISEFSQGLAQILILASMVTPISEAFYDEIMK